MLNLGDYLKSRRQQLEKSLAQVSENTKIPKNLIESLEKSQYDQFSSEVYLKGFIKNYAKYLKIDVNKALAIYRRERNLQKEESLKDSQKPIRDEKPIITPGRIVLFSTITIIIAVITFIVIQLNKIAQPPLLELSEPVQTTAPDESFVEVGNDKLTIAGKIEVGSKLLINGNEVTTNNLQEFRVDNFELNPGSNEIFIIAESYYFSKTSEIKLTVTYNQDESTETVEDQEQNSDQETEEEPVDESLMTIDIETGEQEAWLVVTIDEEIRIQDVVEPGSQFTFESEEVFTIYSPRPQMISLRINGEEYTFGSQSAAIFKLINGNVVQE